MPIKRPTSGRQEAAVLQTFHLVRSSFFYLSAQMVRTQRKRLLACILHTAVLNTDHNSCPPEVMPCPMKSIYSSHQELKRWYSRNIYPWNIVGEEST